MKKLPLALLALLVFALASANAARSLITLDTGEQVIGEILPQSSPVALTVRSALLGEIKVPRARVVEPNTLRTKLLYFLSNRPSKAVQGIVACCANGFNFDTRRRITLDGARGCQDATRGTRF